MAGATAVDNRDDASQSFEGESHPTEDFE